LPAAIKDLFDFKPGWKASFGAIGACKDYVSDFYCAFAEHVEKAGVILLGKIDSPVMGFRGTCDNYLFGPSRNPFNAADGNSMVPAEINGETVDRLIGWCLTYPINFTGHRAASVPTGLSPEKLPVCMQIVGGRHANSDVLAASAAFQLLRHWHDTYRISAGRPV
jgi:Asp-tRNA(Asn)/Glu-tRNA(Gln) amidotransferase A subunit family amidase